MENKMKKLLLIAALFASVPLMANAQTSDEKRQTACDAFSQMTQLTASFRDSGLTASSAYIQMTKSGLNDNIALTIVKIVYDQAPDQTPDTIKALSYIACMQATDQ